MGCKTYRYRVCYTDYDAVDEEDARQTAIEMGRNMVNVWRGNRLIEQQRYMAGIWRRYRRPHKLTRGYYDNDREDITCWKRTHCKKTRHDNR